MTKWITCLAGTGNTMYDAPQEVARIAETIGFQTIYYAHYDNVDNQHEMRLTYFESLLSQIQPGDTVVVQFPTGLVNANYNEEFYTILREKSGVKLIAFLHDVRTYIYAGQNYDPKTDLTLKWLRLFDCLIVHNAKFIERLRADSVQVPMVNMHLFDFCYDGPLQEKHLLPKVYYTSGRRVRLIDYHAKTHLNIIGGRFGEDQLNIHYFDKMENKAIPAIFDGGFGLADTLPNFSINFGKLDWETYNQLNNPFKLSLYLASGLPVIVSSQSAHAAWIQEKNIGLILDNLNDIDDALSNLTEDDYQAMLAAIKPYQKAVSTGYFAKRALMEAIRTLSLTV
ncbi:MAG: beta-1,6-galactofuranosyltransferase [Streptococcaceae bacterium]|jgi:hypothetical protein|nr:beta-1,6-galactofuranosyltransferase [Streptococcaceae bacterium]